MKKISKELMGASSIPFVLLLLQNGDTYGYEIIKRIKELSGGAIIWKEGSLYPVLKKMEGLGYIRFYWNVKDFDRPRKYYSILKKGHDALLDCNAERWFVNDIFDKLIAQQQKGGD